MKYYPSVNATAKKISRKRKIRAKARYLFRAHAKKYPNIDFKQHNEDAKELGFFGGTCNGQI